MLSQVVFLLYLVLDALTILLEISLENIWQYKIVSKTNYLELCVLQIAHKRETTIHDIIDYELW